VDGMSNKYWGWGLEDDEFFVRYRYAIITISVAYLPNALSAQMWWCQAPPISLLSSFFLITLMPQFLKVTAF
jgi:hypothetical protein